ncbi:MAG: RNA-binding domain-containing protein [Thermodesulfobacteriota bacterium]
MNYTDEQLEALLADIESDLAERKESWKGDAPDSGRQAVCAFANDLPDHRKPGVLFIGAKNDGTPSGLGITDELLRTLSDIRTDGNTLSPPSIVVQRFGIGIQTARAEMLKNGNPDIEFQIEQMTVLATLRRRP